VNYSRVMRRIFSVRMAEMAEYKLDLVLRFVTASLFIITNVVFWGAILSRIDNIAGWTFPQIILLLAFIECSELIYYTFFGFSRWIQEEVISGELNNVLTKPANELLFMWVRDFDPIAILMVAPYPIVYFTAAFAMGVEISLTSFLFAFLFCFFAAAVLAIVWLAFESLSFWFGRTGISGIFSSLFYHTYNTPFSVFPVKVKFFISLVIPALFFQLPGMVALNVFTLTELLQLCAALFLVIMLWAGLALSLWKWGLGRYEGHGA